MTSEQSDSRQAQKVASGPEQRLWPTYSRLVGYAFRYKGRIAAMLFFAIIVAGSLSTIIVSVGSIISVLYAAPDEIDGRIEVAQTQARNVADRVESVVGWAPEDPEGRVESVILSMRAETNYALRIMALIIVVLTVFSGAARALQEYYAGAIGLNVSIRLNQEMFANLVSLSHRFYDQRSTGEIVARFTNDSFLVHKGLTEVFKVVFREPIKIGFCLALALSINMYLTLMVLLVLSPIILVVLGISRRVKVAVRKSLKQFSAIASIVTEMVRGISVVKGFRMEQHEVDRANLELTRLRRYQKRLVRARAVVGPVSELLMVLGLAVFLVLSVGEVAEGELTGGELVILFGALGAMFDPLRKLSRIANQIQTSSTSAARVFEFIDYAPDVAERRDAQILAPLQDGLRFEGVGFSYDGETQVLDDVCFEVGRGEMVALVGFSGSGKSTLAKLVPRFYDPTQGRIAMDGVDIRDATLESLREQISIVTQETVLFAETVHDNIAYGRHGVSEERVREAAQAAHAQAFIEAMPRSYDSDLAESGGNLSGGQRQRLAIARAIIKDPAILILDEATSSLDSESEAAILGAIDEFVVGRTTLVIAHRLSTVQKADRIVVLDGGRVAEQGTHAELLNSGGIYQRLYRLQFANHDVAESTRESG